MGVGGGEREGEEVACEVGGYGFNGLVRGWGDELQTREEKSQK